MRQRKLLFVNRKQMRTILDNIYDDYVIKNMTIVELADKYGYSVRQIRYIIKKYLCVKKESRCRRKINIEKIDKNEFIVDGKFARKSTLEDLIEKANMVNKNEKESTNKKVEKNKETN